MRIRNAVLVLAALSAACQRSTSSAPVFPVPERSDKLVLAADPIAGQYLVALADGVDEPAARALAARHGATVLSYVPPPLNAVALRLAPGRALALAADAAVRVAEEDSRVRIASAWNLDRLDQRALPLSAGYDAKTDGSGVHVYVVDTGVLLSHPQFEGAQGAPRADAPASFADGPEGGDCNGHGTHLAGIAAGASVGVAPGARIHSIRAIDCDGVGATSSLVLALDWIREHHESPAVAVVGLTAGLSPALQNALSALVASGVTVVGPAGNDSVDACGRLPAGAPEVITVGATTLEDVVMDPSSQGPCVDLFAPGSEIESAWNDGELKLASGTSQAAAHVAGAVALFLEARPEADPATVTTALLGNATLGALAGVTGNTPNRLLYVGFVEPSFADTTAPAVAITFPAADAEVAGTVAVTATASDDVGVSQVAAFVDGEYLGADAEGGDGYEVAWHTERFGNGSHVLTVRAVDAAGNMGEHAITANVKNPGAAEYDATLGAPVCSAAGGRCWSGALLLGRGPVGPEANAPNTIGSVCGDGTGGRYRQDESIESIEVRTTLPGRTFAEGEWVDVEVTVWGYPDHATDRIDLWFANDAGAPVWQYLGTTGIKGPGLQTEKFSYRLPAFRDKPQRLQQAVRATVRYGGEPAECTDGPYDDHDDLAFAVEKGTADTAKPTVAITAPSRGDTVSGPAVSIAATATDNGGGTIKRVEFLVDDALVAMQPNEVNGAFTVTWNADAVRLGMHLLRAVAYDSSGNFEPSELLSVTVVDPKPPTVVIVRPDPGAVVGGRVHVEADASDNRAVTAVEFRADGKIIGTALSPPWTVDWVTTVASGTATLTAIARDESKNSKTSDPVTVTLDNVAPAASIFSPHAATSVSGREYPVVVQASDANGISKVDVYAGGAYVDEATYVGSTQWSVKWNTATRDNGPVKLTARVYDAAGNPFATDPVEVIVADQTPPVVTITDPPAGQIVRGSIDILASASDDGVVKEVAFLANGRAVGVDAFPPYVMSWDTTDFADGLTTIVARGKDQAGNLGDGTRTVIVDNTGPEVSILEPPAGDVHGTVAVKIRAVDPNGVDHVDVYADAYYLGTVVDTLYLGTATPVPPKPGDPSGQGLYALSWPTTWVDNRSFRMRAVAADVVENVSTSDPVMVRVDNLTTAEYDAALGAPACKSSASWCFSGTLLDGAGRGELNAPNTLGGACADGYSSAYHATESVDALTVEAYQGALASGGRVKVTVRYWAYAANEADQVDVYHAANALDPSWVFTATLTPVATGENVQSVDLTLPSGPLQVIRANFRFAHDGPSTCSERVLQPNEPMPADDFGDRDDLVFAVDSPADTTAPSVVLDTPANGGTVSGDVWIRAAAGDDQGIARVEFFVDGGLLETVLTPLPDGSVPATYQAIWPSQLGVDGLHELVVKAHDTSGNVSSTPPSLVTVTNAVNATFDVGLGVPACDKLASFCDPGTLLDGRGPIGSGEPHDPNTLGTTCSDGTAGAYHVDESLDWLKVSSVDGLPLTAGKRARVEARVWAYTGWSDDALDLFYATAPDDPSWVHFATVKPAGPGAHTLVTEYTLPPSAWQAVRGRFRYGGTVQPCGNDLYDDADDLVFAVDYTPNASHDLTLGAPACSGTVAWCDTGTLVEGRGPLGPELHDPNTLGSTCRDGTLGQYHVDPSVDGLLVASPDGAPLSAGRTARLEVRMYASASWAQERVELFTTANPESRFPAWQYLGTVKPSREGSQVLYATVPLGAAGRHAIRAHLRNDALEWWWPWYEGDACGTDDGVGVSVVDDQDDLVFEVAP